mmetsp:Transcript_13949/g.21088  ORF Transcript_13949/g.21088 Transcript_13949/m.21088 type:complete len:601 (-) Transcript_13949:344-2146(-)
MFSPARVIASSDSGAKAKRTVGQRNSAKKNKKTSPKAAKFTKKGTGTGHGEHHLKFHMKMRMRDYATYPPKPQKPQKPQQSRSPPDIKPYKFRERISPSLRSTVTTQSKDSTAVGTIRKSTSALSVSKQKHISRLSSRSSRQTIAESGMNMTDLFGTLPPAARAWNRSSILTRRRAAKKKLQSSNRSAKSVSKQSSRSSSRYSLRLGSTRTKKYPPSSRKSSRDRESTRGVAVNTGTSNCFTVTAVSKITPANDPPSPFTGVLSSTDSSNLEVASCVTKALEKHTISSQTEFKDDQYGPLYAALPDFIQRLRERRVAHAAARGFRSSTKLHMSTRSTQTRPYSAAGILSTSVQENRPSQSNLPAQAVIQKLMRQQEQMLQALATLKLDRRHRKAQDVSLKLKIEGSRSADRSNSPHSDVYSEFNSPRSRLGAVKRISNRRRVNTEPRRTVSGRHVIPGVEEDTSDDSDTKGSNTRACFPGQTRFSNVPPLNLAKTKISSTMMTPRSYGSETCTTRSSPDRSRMYSIGRRSFGAFNPLSGSARSGISSSRSFRSASSIGVVLDEKSNASFELRSENSMSMLGDSQKQSRNGKLLGSVLKER